MCQCTVQMSHIVQELVSLGNGTEETGAVRGKPVPRNVGTDLNPFAGISRGDNHAAGQLQACQLAVQGQGLAPPADDVLREHG